MGISLTFKSYTSKSGKRQLIFRVQTKGVQYEKATNIKLLPKDFNKEQLRVKSTVPSYLKHNKRLSELKELIFNAYDLYESGAYTFEEFKYRVESENTTLDVFSFLEDTYKASKSEVTYENYRSVLVNYKRALDYKQLRFTDFEYANISKFIRLCKDKGLSPNSINTYITHIKAVVNEAYNRGLTERPFKSHKTYRQRRTPQIAITANTEDLQQAIDKAKDIRDIQTIAMWLLQFTMRGLYLKDLMTMHTNALTDASGEIRHVQHKRSKTGEPMLILYSCEPTEGLILLLQHSFHITHKDYAPKLTEPLELLIYNVQDYRLHNNLMDVYKKRATRLIGKSFKTARKTFESIAMYLDVSSSIRYKLLGHVDASVKRHYLNWEWEKLVDKVDEAHIKVLTEFKAQELYTQLLAKTKALGLPEQLYSETLTIEPI